MSENPPYQLAATAKVLGIMMAQAKTNPLAWARAFHTQWSAGQQAPSNKHVNPLTLRATFRAVRMLGASADASDKKKAHELSLFLKTVWGIYRAHESVAEGEVELSDELRELWGDAQLPPAGAMVGSTPADELLIVAAVRRLR